MKKTLQLLGAMAVGGLFGYGVMFLGLNNIPKASAKLLFGAPAGLGEGAAKVMVGLFGFWLAFALHELGHLLTGLAQGFKFYLYVAGWLGVRRHAVTGKVEWFFNKDVGLMGGVAATVPTKREPTLRYKLAAVCAAGPVVSLLTGGAATAATFLLLQNSDNLDSVAARVALVFGFTFGIISLALFLATTLPTRTGPFFTDRARFFRLIGGGQAAQTEQAMLELMAHSVAGFPYADLDLAQIDLLRSSNVAFMQNYGHILAYYRHLDRGAYDTALSEILAAESLVSDEPQLYKVEVWKDVAFAQAFLARNAPAARQAWARIPAAFQKQPTAQIFVIQAVLALAEGQTDIAQSFIEKAQNTLPTEPTKAEDKLYQKLLRAVQARLAETTPTHV